MIRRLAVATAAMACVASPALAQADSALDALATRFENAERCHQVANQVADDLEAQGHRVPWSLLSFKTRLSETSLQAMREFRDASNAAGRRVDFLSPRRRIGDQVSAIRAQGEAALRAELRRCWTIFDDRPVPRDLDRPNR